MWSEVANIRGPVGPPLNPKGTVPTSADLPPGAAQGDLWTAIDTGHGWGWGADNLWHDLGQFEGDKGVQGDTGAAGPPGIQGNPGPPGNQGPPGSAAGVAVGTTSTLPPGSAATVTNSGTPTGAVLNFGIPQGVTGVAGPIGPAGPQGPAGTGLNMKGTVATAADLPTTGNQPNDCYTALDTGHGWVWNGTQWIDIGLIQGPAGPAGPPGTNGSPGSPGSPGTAATVSVGTTTTGAAGSNANVTDSGTPNAAVLNFTIPQGIAGTPGSQGPPGQAGAQGPSGSQGPPGTAATVAVGTTSTLAPGTPATVTNTGSPSAATFNFGIPQGVVGPVGPTGSQGPAGNAATIAAGTATSLAPGSNPTVTNSGSSSAAVFNFGIPQGATGSAGPIGPQGNPGISPVTTTTQNFTVPAVGSSTTVTVTDASGLSLGQMVSVANAAGTNLSGELQITGISGNQLMLLNPAAPPAIPNASTAGAGLLAQLSGNATDYVGGDNACHPIASLLIPGMVSDYAGATAPNGWLLCQGQAVSRTGYPNLYAAIGTLWGAGDGSTTFNLPDLRSRISVGAGQGTGLTNRVLAAAGGEENHVLSVAELAAHNHQTTENPHTHGTSDPTHTHQYQWVGISGSGAVAGAGLAANNPYTTANYTGVTVAANATGLTIQNNGSSSGHNNMQPFAVLNKIIKT